MAQKRMFDKGLIETDAFLDMPMPTKALYFLLGMEADDEGFVSPKRVTRLYGGNDDDLKILLAKGFVIQFDSGVMVITDWKENNYLDKNRIKETVYQNEKKLLLLSKNKYMLNDSSTNVQPMLTQYRREEKSIEEKRREEYSDESLNEINSIINLFKSINPSYQSLFKRSSERSAAAELLKTHGYEKISKLIESLPEIVSQPYAPKITTPCQLLNNLGKLGIFIKQKQNESIKSSFGTI